MTKYAHINIRLRGFAKADTQSQIEGYLEPGKYIVKEFRENYPDSDSDYALLLVPALGAGDTWICTRWKEQRYVEITKSTPASTTRLVFSDQQLAVDEEILINLLQQFETFTYTPDEARYPYQLPGLRLPQAPPEQNNCCTFVEALLVKAWTDTFSDFTWSPGRHGQMMILSNDDYYSPVTAAVESGMAISVTNPDSPPHPWSLVQGWRRQWRGGHTFIIVDHHEETDRVLTLESNSAYRLNGVGFRAMGNLRDTGGKPPENWWQNDALWTWEKIQATYQYRQQARLKVKSRSWSGIT